MSGLKSELARLKKTLESLPGDGDGGKTVLPHRVWGWIAGAIPWDELTPDERAAWEAHCERVDREYPPRDIETELTNLNPTEEN